MFVTFWLEVNYQLFVYFYLTVCLLLNGSNFVPLWTQFEYRVYNFFTECIIFIQSSPICIQSVPICTQSVPICTQCTNLYTDYRVYQSVYRVYKFYVVSQSSNIHTYIHITKQLLDPHVWHEGKNLLNAVSHSIRVNKENISV